MSSVASGALIDALAPLVQSMREATPLRTAESERQLAERIYHSCHSRQELLRALAPTRAADESTDSDFVTRLSVANSGVGPQHHGWIVTAIEDEGRYAVEKDGLTLWIDAPAEGTVGQQVPVRFPNEYRNLYPGHYVAIGDADDGSLDNSLRLYWNVSAEGGESLVRHVTEVFNLAGIPFRLKTLNSPAAYTRADAAILYIPRSHRAQGATAIGEVYRNVRSHLRAPVSPFVLPLAPGLGLAEDPNDGSSFGMHRSQLLAAVLLDTLNEADPLGSLTTTLERRGYALNRFYLNPRSTETYSEFVIDAG